MSEFVPPDVDQVLSQLKDFQRATVDYVHRRLWLDDEPAHRFLVADEVGLGKTLVAKGVIARTLDHLRDADRVDLVYICSNSQIARQNIARLNITGQDLNHADRLTLLARQIRELRSRRVNVVSFTPGTSFNIGDSSGRVEERALIYALLRHAWGRSAVSSAAWRKFFMDAASEASFLRAVDNIKREHIDAEIADALATELHTGHFDGGAATLEDALEECVSHFRYRREGATVDRRVRRERTRLIGRMRAAVAGAAIGSLRPSLVILDEFQRFKALLDEANPTAQLAHALFKQGDVRLLLLSATPYKMYTLPDEPEGDEHYADFEATLRFLAGPSAAASVCTDLAIMRRGILEPAARDAAVAARQRVQVALRRYIARTERLASTPNRDGMLAQRETSAALTPNDVRAFQAGSAVAEAVGGDDILEYWRSTPYLLNLMDNYKLKDRFKTAVERKDLTLAAVLRRGTGLIDWESIDAYQRLDPANAKMRALIADVIDRGTWKLAWLPPCLPYYSLGGDYARPELAEFTKRLVFSAWNVVPKAIATLVSYEAERAAATRVDPGRRYGTATTPLLAFSRSEGRLSGMPLLALLYPSATLAQLGDPLQLAQEAGEVPLPRARMESVLRDRAELALTALPEGRADGPPDQAWYWAAPFLLDRRFGRAQADFLSEMLSWGNQGDDDARTPSAQHDHIREAATFDPLMLGRRPDDLAHVLALLAIAGPGNAALRALHRVGPDLELHDVWLRVSAADISWAIRSLFNQPHITDGVRYGKRDEAYWRAVLDHCHTGCLQAVLDEWVHILVETEGQQAKPSLERTEAVARAVTDAMGLRRSSNLVDDIRVVDDTVVTERRPLNAHFAVRFGRDVSDTEKALDREKAVRAAFNSPFWPFVLASTSVGQEGLDFHLYSHAVVHWNLPSNPVDLEQREGRVHRYKNHAVRKNVAKQYARAVLEPDVVDPWAAMFDAARDDRPAEGTDLIPFWIFAPAGGAVIERYVPALPLSLESARLHRLQRTVGAYRTVFGQARQEDLLSYAQHSEEDLSWLSIDLMPPPARPAPALRPDGRQRRSTSDTTWDRDREVHQLVATRCSDPVRSRTVKEFLRRAQDRFGIAIDVGTSERSASGESDYLMVRDLGPQRFGAIAYVTPRTGNLNFRLRKEDVADLVEEVVLRDVREQHDYQVRLVLEQDSDLDLAVDLIGRALRKVRA